MLQGIDTTLVLLALGILILVLGIALKYGMKNNLGLLLVVVSIGWLFTIGLYYGLVSAGLYGTAGEAGGYVTNIIGILLFVGGILGILYFVKMKGGSGGT